MRLLRSTSYALAILLAGTPVHAQQADHTLRLVFPFPVGGAGDALVRMVADSMQTTLRRPVIVENKAGAGGRIGVQTVKAAPADGSVLLITPVAPMVVFPHVYDNLGYDPVADFQPISQIAVFDLAVAVASHVPANSLPELVAWYKSNPTKASYGSPAAGSLPHFFAVQLAQIAQLDLRHVAYKGSPPALADLIGGHLPAYFGPTQELVETHAAGNIRILATSGTARSPALTKVPTFQESGFSMQANVWFGVYAPRGTSAEVATMLNKAVVAAIKNVDISERMIKLGLRPTGTSSEELARIQQADFERWGPIVRASGFKPTQ
jgi:tripartite-type tricarboxylate transporter receptor subunit TctC